MDRNSLDRETYNRLRREAIAPYRGLRKFIYAGLGASGAIGGFVFFFKVLAGRDLASDLPNLALQVGVVAVMLLLFQWENQAERKEEKRRQQVQNFQKIQKLQTPPADQ